MMYIKTIGGTREIATREGMEKYVCALKRRLQFMLAETGDPFDRQTLVELRNEINNASGALEEGE